MTARFTFSPRFPGRNALSQPFLSYGERLMVSPCVSVPAADLGEAGGG